jgi:predicted XRE-type DNA-binding protein
MQFMFCMPSERPQREPGSTILIWHESDCERLMAKTIEATENLFESFGVPSAIARNLQIRSSLMIEVEKFIRSRSMTQAEAAKYFGVSQPYISDLMNGRIDRVSIDKLITLLDRAGQSVTISVRRGRNGVRSAGPTQ